MTEISSLDFDSLTNAIESELTSILPELAGDSDVFGFAIFVPEDAGSAFLTYSFGRESKISTEPGTTFEKDQRYSPIEWMDTPPAFDTSNSILDGIAELFEATTEDMTDEQAESAHDEFITCCARSAMIAMQRKLEADAFGSIWYRTLMMTDEEHPILNQAFEKLNTGRALAEAKFMFGGDA
jgi:hypothetical protein